MEANLSVDLRVRTHRALATNHIRTLAFAWGISHPTERGQMIIQEIDQSARYAIALEANHFGYLSDDALCALSLLINKLKASAVTSGAYRVEFNNTQSR